MMEQHTNPLHVSHVGRPTDACLILYVEPDADLGCIDAELFGPGMEPGFAQAIGDAAYVALLSRMAAHLLAYTTGYADAARLDTGIIL